MLETKRLCIFDTYSWSGVHFPRQNFKKYLKSTNLIGKERNKMAFLLLTIPDKPLVN